MNSVVNMVSRPPGIGVKDVQSWSMRLLKGSPPDTGSRADAVPTPTTQEMPMINERSIRGMIVSMVVDGIGMIFTS